MELLTKRLRLRGPRDSDLKPLLHAMNDWRVIQWFDSLPYPHHEADGEVWLRAVIDNLNGPEPGMFLVADINSDDLIGAATLERKEGSKRFYLGYWIAPRYWGQGYASEACRPLTEYAHDHLKLNELFAAVAPHNAASKRVLSKLLFEEFSSEDREGTRAGHHRMLLYRRELE